MTRDDFPSLFQFLAGTFHQDFNYEYPSDDAAIADFMASESPDTLAKTKRELDIFIPLLEQSANPADLLSELSCYYDPTADGMSVIDWLKKIQLLWRP